MKYLCWWSFVLGNQVHSQQLSDAKLCLFNVNQKRAFEQIVKLLEIYNEHCVWMECRKCPFHRYWILIIPWFLNKQTDCITFPMNIVVVLKNLLNKQMSLCEQSVICQVQLNYDLTLSTTDDQDPVLSHDMNFGHDIFAIDTAQSCLILWPPLDFNDRWVVYLMCATVKYSTGILSIQCHSAHFVLLSLAGY